jgi:tRNA A37 threonylcarbamoyladenosine biosynthesis protein TsaE
LHHIDLYRLGPGADVRFLDLDSLAAEAPIVLEWGGYADLAGWSPIHVSIEPIDAERRTISVSGAERLLAAWDRA